MTYDHARGGISIYDLSGLLTLFLMQGSIRVSENLRLTTTLSPFCIPMI